MQYFALNANPDKYRVQGAVAALEMDYWTTGRSRLSPGDRVLIWKSYGRQGRSASRGVVAFGEVLESAKSQASPNRFWVNPEDGRRIAYRIKVRYLLPPKLPLWEDEHPILKKLTVSGGQGTVFRVPPDLFACVVSQAGGWSGSHEEEEVPEHLHTSTAQPMRVPEEEPEETNLTADLLAPVLNETRGIPNNTEDPNSSAPGAVERVPSSLWTKLTGLFRLFCRWIRLSR
jgi:hypothetical protein